MDFGQEISIFMVARVSSKVTFFSFNILELDLIALLCREHSELGKRQYIVINIILPRGVHMLYMSILDSVLCYNYLCFGPINGA